MKETVRYEIFMTVILLASLILLASMLVVSQILFFILLAALPMLSYFLGRAVVDKEMVPQSFTWRYFPYMFMLAACPVGITALMVAMIQQVPVTIWLEILFFVLVHIITELTAFVQGLRRENALPALRPRWVLLAVVLVVWICCAAVYLAILL